MSKYFELDMLQAECFALVSDTLKGIHRKYEKGELSEQQFTEVQQLCSTIRMCHLFKDCPDQPRYSEADLADIDSEDSYEDAVTFLKDFFNDRAYSDANSAFFDDAMDAHSGAAAPSDEDAMDDEVVHPADDWRVYHTTDEKMEQ
ncbi:unnamed protein product [Angiostrongylus costaricensis]|uniref:RNA polymerase II nuclear localization protein SLC7A6OS n=1 Tax=Angiostrongylus costaricensis TaxID=334426 RepID=A0A0R3PBM4_ANGCS|nr:unnamed protein product [Angiostrongylus costaricensis]